jgi:hypothetical protein
MEIEKDSRQVPKVVEICSDKKYNDILYSYLQTISKDEKREDGTIRRYIEKKDINYTALGEVLKLSRQTISVKFKNLMELGLITYIPERKIYELVVLAPDIAALIPKRTLSKMVHTLSENSVSTYVYLLQRYWANGCKPFVFMIDNIKIFVGLSLNTTSNNPIIIDILEVLQGLDLIRYRMYTDKFGKKHYELLALTNKLFGLKNVKKVGTLS